MDGHRWADPSAGPITPHSKKLYQFNTKKVLGRTSTVQISKNNKSISEFHFQSSAHRNTPWNRLRNRTEDAAKLFPFCEQPAGSLCILKKKNQCSDECLALMSFLRKWPYRNVPEKNLNNLEASNPSGRRLTWVYSIFRRAELYPINFIANIFLIAEMKSLDRHRRTDIVPGTRTC